MFSSLVSERPHCWMQLCPNVITSHVGTGVAVSLIYPQTGSQTQVLSQTYSISTHKISYTVQYTDTRWRLAVCLQFNHQGHWGYIKVMQAYESYAHWCMQRARRYWHPVFMSTSTSCCMKLVSIHTSIFKSRRCALLFDTTYFTVIIQAQIHKLFLVKGLYCHKLFTHSHLDWFACLCIYWGAILENVVKWAQWLVSVNTQDTAQRLQRSPEGQEPAGKEYNLLC